MKGVIAAGHKVTAEAGAQILRAGGNAYDAVLGAMFASTVPEAILSSIGGGGFLMAQPTGRPTSGSTHKGEKDRGTHAAILYDFFVNTPQVKRAKDDLDFHAIHADFGPATQEFHIGVGSAAMPGIIPGAYAIHRDLCTMPMADILAPAIEAARSGVRVNEFHGYLYTIVEPILRASPEVEAIYAPSGALLKTGEIYKNGALAETFEALAQSGEALFTTGAVGTAILKQSLNNGGQISDADFDHYQVVKRAPLNWQYGSMDIAFNPGPAQGGALIACGLGLLEEFKTQGDDAPGIGDLISVMELTNDMRDTYGAELSHDIDRALIVKHLKQARGHKSQSRGTTHISVIDDDGNAASLTLSNGEGCGHMVGGFGFMLNNMLGEEDLNPGGFHQWTPGTRLSTMMAPLIMRDADGRLVALGSGGSNRIRTAILQVIYHLIDRGLDLRHAVDHPRLHLERDGTLSFEDLFNRPTREEIIAAADSVHPWPQPNMFFGGVNSVERMPDGALHGVGDARRGGVAIVVD